MPTKKHRPILWVMAANIRGRMVMEAITWKASTDPDTLHDFEKGERECRKAFLRKYKKAPSAIFGPVYLAKGTTKKDTGKVLVPVEAMVRKTDKVFSAEYMGKKVLGNGLKGLTTKTGTEYGDNELISPYYTDPAQTGTRGFGSRTALILASLKNVRELKDEKRAARRTSRRVR